MTSKRRFVLSLLSTSLVVYLAAGPLMTRVFGSDSGYAQLSIFHEVMSMVRDSYVDPVNMERTIQAAERGLMEALDGDSAVLDDQEFKDHVAGKKAAGGTGIVLGRRFGFLTVVASVPGSPARRAGLKSGDFIKTIDGKHTHGLSLYAGQRLLEGDPGSTVRLAVFKTGGDTNDVDIVREKETAAPAPVVRQLDGGVAYVAVSEISDASVESVKNSLRTFDGSGAGSLILDLRSSASGAFPAALRFAELFVPGKIVAKISGRASAEQTLTAPGTVAAWQGAIVVLTDRGTAGAAEVVAAGLAHAGISIVGENTFGRAGIQRPVPLPSGGGLVLTVSRYFTPKGDPIHGKGIAPTVQARNPETPDLIGTVGRDPILDKGIATVKSGA